MAHFSQLPFFTLSPTIHSSLKHHFSAVYTLLLSNILTLKVPLYCPNYKLLSLIGSLHEIPLEVGEFEINSAVSFFSSVLMADSEYSTSNDTICVDSQEESSQEAKLEFSEDEETLIIRMFNLVGERWSLIAGRIPGRTAEEIEKYWNSRYSTSE